MGEHCQYNGGPVLAIATPERAHVALGWAEDGVIESVSRQGAPPERLSRDSAPSNDVLACLQSLRQELMALGAVSLHEGTRGLRVATAAELSPRRARECPPALAVALARALAALADARLSPRQLRTAAFRASQGRARSASSVADHTVAAFARPNHVLLVESASADVRQVPLNRAFLRIRLGGASNARAALLEERHRECAAALTRLKVELPELLWLASWPSGWLARLKRSLPEPLRSRALHVVGETARARFGAELLEQGRVARFGGLLDESHESSRRLYDWSAPRLDLVVAAARRASAAGARLTGLGAADTAFVMLGRGDRGEGKGAALVRTAIRRALGRGKNRNVVVEALRPEGGVRMERVR